MSGPSAGPVPLGPPPGVPSAGPLPTGAAGPTAPTLGAPVGAGTGAAAPGPPVPVSVARAQRAAEAGALRRPESDPLEIARRIAAALNVGNTDPRFTWLTGLTKDGAILVANNYGLGYMPPHTRLPQQVKFTSVDESIPAKERGRSATYPILALHSWAQAHNTALRAVIGLEEQLKLFDTGAAPIVLQPDDLPPDGRMQGRSRFELIAPEAADRLSKVSDGSLMELLPAAPVDPQPPEDVRVDLLMEVFLPLINSDPGRAIEQLNAMVDYAEHMQAVALYQAYVATDGETLRTAVTDAMYWYYVGSLNSEAAGATE
jgi:hypothetical protein